MKQMITCICATVFPGICFCQTIEFKGQLLYNNSVVKNYTVIIDGRPTTTDFSGVFTTTVAASLSQVKVQPSDKRYFILYPAAGRILIPKDNSLITEIMVGNFKSNPTLKAYIDVSDKIKKQSGSITEMNDSSLKKKLDSITSLLLNINYTKDDLLSAREKHDGMDMYYPRISGDLTNVLKQFNIINNAFKYTADFAFESQRALVELVTAVNSFNPAIDNFYLNQPANSKRIMDYWEDRDLQNTYEAISDTILKSITKRTVTSLNDIKTRINQYFKNELPGDKRENKQKIQKEIYTVVEVFDNQIKALEIVVDSFLKKLSDY